MVFGRKGMGDKLLEEQRQHVARTESELTNLEQAIARLPSYRVRFSDVWFDSPEVADATVQIQQAREIVEQIKRRLTIAREADPQVAAHLRIIEQMLASKLVVLDSFAAILIGRQHIWNAGNKSIPFNPSIRECQEALHGDASRLAAAVQTHITELVALREDHQDIWPANLDLAHIQAYLDDGRKALDIYSHRFASQDVALPPESSVTLLALAQRMEKGVQMIEEERANLAVAIVTRGGLKGTGSSCS